MKSFKAIPKILRHVKGQLAVQRMANCAGLAQGLGSGRGSRTNSKEQIPVILDMIRQNEFFAVIILQGKNRLFRPVDSRWQAGEYFFRRKGKHRRHVQKEHTNNMPESALRGSAPMSGFLIAIKPVFQDIKIKCGQIVYAVIVQTMVYLMKFKVHIGPHQAFVQDGGIGHGKAIQRQHIFGIDKRIVAEILEIAEQKTAGIADASVGIDKAREDDIRNADIFLIIDAGRPEPNNFGPVLADQLGRCNDIADGFGHFAALAIHNIPVGQHGLVWRGVAQAFRNQQ